MTVSVAVKCCISYPPVAVLAIDGHGLSGPDDIMYPEYPGTEIANWRVTTVIYRTVSQTRDHVAALEQRGIKVVWGAINNGIFRRSCHPPLAEWPDNRPKIYELPDGHHWLSYRHRYIGMPTH